MRWTVWNNGTAAKMHLLFIWKCQSSSSAVRDFSKDFMKAQIGQYKWLCLCTVLLVEIQNYSSLRITRNQWQNIKAVHEIFQYWPTSSLIKITLSFAIDFSGRVRPILCANEIAFQKASPVVLSNCSKPWVTIWLQKYWGACQHCETYFLALHGSNLPLVGCGREQKPRRWLISTESVHLPLWSPSSGPVEQKHNVEELGRNSHWGCSAGIAPCTREGLHETGSLRVFIALWSGEL